MYIYRYIGIFMYTHIRATLRKYKEGATTVGKWACSRLCVCVCVCVCVYIYMKYGCIYVHMYLSIYKYIHIYIYILTDVRVNIYTP